MSAALGWALLHSLWQLALVGAGAALLLRAAGPGRPRVQYAVAYGALVLCLAVPALGFLRGLAATAVLAVPDAAPLATGGGAVLAAAPASGPARLLALASAHLGWVSAAWALGAVLMALRLGGGWLTTVAWRRQGRPAPAAWERRFRDLARAMGAGGNVLLLASARVASPVAAGLWRPVVLVPAALFTRLPEAYLEALLAHELAHVARHDFLFNLLQGVIEVLCFHHPVVWWLSRRVRTLREHLCDDLAARAVGEPRRLALALDALDDVQPHLTSMALAARGGTLHERIRRLLNPPSHLGSGPWAFVPALALVASCATLALRAAVPAAPPIQGDVRILAELDALAAREGLDPQLLRSMAWAESSLNPKATSSQGAMGVLQVMPATAKRFGAADLADPKAVAAAGARYLKFLLARYQGDTARAVAAYNCGEEALEAGRIGPEATGYRALVLDLLRARAVQPAAPLGQACVDGTLRRGGTKLTVSARVSSRGGFRLEFLPVDAAGKVGAEPCGVVQVGGTEPGTAWMDSHPVVTFPLPEGASALVVRCTSTGAGVTGETRLALDASWKTFAFRMEPRG